MTGKLVLATVAAFGLTVFGVPATQPAVACADEIRLRTLWIEMEPVKKSYRPGDRVVFEVVVTRPAHEDPLGLEQPIDPPASSPAEGIPVNAGVDVGDVYAYGHTAETDAEGKVLVPVKLPRWMGAGSASVDLLAKIKQADSPCYDVVEEGYRQFPDAFRVRR